MKNIHILPTDKPSRLVIDTIENKLYHQAILHKKTVNVLTQNIYITSDEEIKDVRPYKGKWQLEQGDILNKFPTYLTDLEECKLVIMTTDQDLIKDGVQAIDDEFLEWFVKNPSCEKVGAYSLGIEDETGQSCHYKYEIIIPKEEPKQETLEEAAKRYTKEEIGLGFYPDIEIAFEKGAKWQQERMYSEEEVYNIIIDLLKRIQVGQIINYGEIEEWFEQFKKK